MVQRLFTLTALLMISACLFGQQKNDTTVKVNDHYVTLSEIVVDNKLDVSAFIDRVKNDTTFYKAFRNLRIIGYTALNDIRMLDEKGNSLASLRSKTKQIRIGNCRKMETLNESVTGNMYDAEGNFNYYTARMYAGLFFTKDSVCGETNIVKGS